MANDRVAPFRKWWRRHAQGNGKATHRQVLFALAAAGALAAAATVTANLPAALF